MESQKLDVIIFGATGFTGKYLVKEFVKYAHKKYTWGIAGRNRQKLDDVLKVTSSETGEDITGISVVIADCSDEESIDKMAKKAKIIINCCGPYRFYGETVVKACIENGTHHVDVSGEPEYMETMQVKYNDEAAKKKVYIVSGCGFDCIPSDLGVVHFKNNFDGVLNSVEAYLKMDSTSRASGPRVNYGTWHTAVHEISNVSHREDLRSKLFPKGETPNLKPKLQRRPIIHRSELVENKYCLPFPGADPSVVRRSQFMLYKLQKQRPIQFHAFVVCKDFLTLTGFILVGIFLNVLTKFSFGVKLLLNYPEFFTFGTFSHKEPSVEAVDSSSVTIIFHGEGWSNESVEGVEDKTAISSPTNKSMDMKITFSSPGYGFTSRGAIFSALTILEEPEKLPPQGGVYTTAVAFGNTKLLDKLVETGVTIELLK